MAEPRRLSVVQVLPALHGGGVERGTLEIGEALVGAGHRSLVVSAGGRMVAELEAGGSEHVTLPVGLKSPRVVLQAGRLRALLAETGADIVHARSRLPAWIARLALRGLPAASRPRLVTTVHGFYSVGRYSAVMISGERVIAVSESIRRYILDNYPTVASSRIELIPRGVDASRWPRGHRPADDWMRQLHARHPECAGRSLLTIAARLTRLKGHEDFLDLIGRLAASGLPVHGLVVGAARRPGDAYAAMLQQRARREALPVSFLGPRDDMRDIYAASSAVLSLSSRPESFGRSVLEALCMGVPVLGYEHGGVGEILAAMLPNGRVVAGDVQTATARLAGWLRDGAPSPAPNAFPLALMKQRTLDLYARLAGSPRDG